MQDIDLIINNFIISLKPINTDIDSKLQQNYDEIKILLNETKNLLLTKN
jgi:hypothetical protein